MERFHCRLLFLPTVCSCRRARICVGCASECCFTQFLFTESAYVVVGIPGKSVARRHQCYIITNVDNCQMRKGEFPNLDWRCGTGATLWRPCLASLRAEHNRRALPNPVALALFSTSSVLRAPSRPVHRPAHSHHAPLQRLKNTVHHTVLLTFSHPAHSRHALFNAPRVLPAIARPPFRRQSRPLWP